jgi:hypothetical protein
MALRQNVIGPTVNMHTSVTSDVIVDLKNGAASWRVLVMELRFRRLLTVLCILCPMTAAAGCASNENGAGGNGCLPIDLRPEPATAVVRGQTITIISPGYACTPRSVHGAETISYGHRPLAVVGTEAHRLERASSTS